MMTRLFWAILVPFFTYLSSATAATQISCSHPELCRLARVIFSENHINNYEFTSLIKIVGDPHEYEPTTLEVKNLINAEILISGPHELNPWVKKVNYQRSKLPQLKSINIPLDKKDYDLYPDATHESLSHFWLYPKLFCAVKTHMEEQMVALKYLVLTSGRKNCVTEQQKIENELSQTLAKLNLPVVLTHDALLPLLVSLSKNASSVVAIKGSGHHQEASTKSVKNLYDALAAPKVIWIEEANINVPQNILSKKRSNDFVVKIDTANSEGMDYFQILQNLNNKLKALK